jgi:hypothetical protein
MRLQRTELWTMKTKTMMTPAAAGLLAGLIAALAWPAHQAAAQAALPSPTSIGPVVKGGSGIGPAQPSAPGLPGARAGKVIPRGAINADLLSPNDELFDAIDRGDTSAARDAIARGAELQATNAVGQTPIDESVALGRNEITFLLVTLLHAGGSDITDAQGPMAMPPPNTLGLSSKDERVVSTPVSFFGSSSPSTGTRRKTHYYASAERTTEAPASAPSYANTTGAPVPSAGFVGFGSSGQ